MAEVTRVWQEELAEKGPVYVFREDDSQPPRFAFAYMLGEPAWGIRVAGPYGEAQVRIEAQIDGDDDMGDEVAQPNQVSLTLNNQGAGINDLDEVARLGAVMLFTAQASGEQQPPATS